jgi:Calx-beta domain/Lamin Tail Domain/Bacterial Ig-like domain (group 2)/WD40-like Beta Propeller Repeat
LFFAQKPVECTRSIQNRNAPVLRLRIFTLILAGVAVLCLLGVRRTQTQSVLRRITNTTEEGININPSISGDGRIVAFESTEDIAGAGGTDQFRAIRANVAVDPPTFFQMGGTRAAAAAISQDGSRIAFASKDDPLGTNPDGNSEIFLFDGARLSQVTNTSPGDIANRVTNGNFQPSISDDGRFIAFSSNRDLAGQNADGNLELFIYDAVATTFTQLTNSSGIVGNSDAKISGNGAKVAFVRDPGATPSARRDLMIQDRASGPATVIASQVQALLLTYGRAISDDGTRVAYSGETATNSSQVFLFDGRGGNSTRQITSLGTRVTEVPLHATISGDGNRVAFATRRNFNSFNSDGSVELYVHDVPSATFSRITNAPSTATADVVSSLNDDGSIVAFSFPRVLSGPVNDSSTANNSEIYVTATPPRPAFGTLTVVNGASFGNEPSTTKAVAPDSIAVARGGALANTTLQSQRLSNGTFPTSVGGTTVTVNGRPAQIFFVSPGQVNFLVPPATEIGTADVLITNSENFQSRGSVPTLRAAPGVFTKPGDGTGEGMILNSDTLQSGPFDPTSGNLRLTIFTTGARNATQTLVVVGGRVVNADSVIASPDMPGLDEIRVLVPADLRGAGTVDLFVQSDGRASNSASITFIGDGTRDILINEVLADPPGSAANDLQGDANHDGVRSSNDDEFVELVNTTSHDIDLGGYQLKTRSSTATSDGLRHTFGPGTILSGCSTIVVFGGGTFDPNNPAFGGAQVVKATSGGLSLTNSGAVITLFDQAAGVVTLFTYGGSTGLNGGASQALTRSPDVTGSFVLHQSAAGSAGKLFSPGTRVDGTPFLPCPPIARVDVSPTAASIITGAHQQFTARAFDAGNHEVTGVIFTWQSSSTSVATIDQNGLATGVGPTSTEIRATGRGVTSAPASLTVQDVARVLTSVTVSPNTATIPATGAQQFTGHGFDQFSNEIVGLTFTWESTNTSAATIDATGLATGISQGQTTIKATSQSITGTAMLNVTPPTIVINEALAAPPTGTDGDANHDGVRSSSDDEFVELVNSTGAGISIAGWTVRTHSTSSSTETIRHTFVAGTTVPAGEAMVVFGGGTFSPTDPVFGCAQVVKASSGSLLLTDAGLTILIRDGSGNLVTQFSYGGSTGLNGGNAQSLTRSPDITGNFVQHTTIAGARKFSPGLKVDGTPFGNCTVLSVGDVTLSEGDSGSTTFNFVVSLNRPAPPGGVTFNIGTQDNTATVAGNDYVALSLTAQTIPAGQQTYNFAVTVNGDLIIEPDETFFVNVSNVANALVADGQGVGTILNDDSPSLSINDVSASEGNSGPTTFTFTVTSTLPAPAGGITFDIATQDGTATSASGDYVARSLTSQSIPAGQTTYTFNVTVNGDTLVEPNETFFVNISNVSANASVSDGQGLGTIQNDDTANLVISQVYGGGGNTGATFKNDFIELYNRGTTTVDLSITPYSVQYAGVGSNFGTDKTNLSSGVIAPGKYFLVQEAAGSGGTTSLPTPDATGTFALTAGSGKVALVAGTTALSPANSCPGDDGSSPFNASNSSIADFVGYGNSPTTAGHCYEGSGPAAPPSNTTADFRKAGGCVDTNDNASDFFVATPNPRNSSSPIGDCKPDITINDVTKNEGNTGTTSFTFTVSLSAASAQTVTVDFATADGTASAPTDYQATSGTLTFNPGDLTKTVTVLVNGDNANEPSETFFVNLTNATNAVFVDSQGLGTITNDDAQPSLSINDASVAEGDSSTTPATFTVTLSAASSFTVTVNYATADNSATSPSDYQSTSGTLTFNPGETTKPVTVLVNGDTTFEQDETFFVNLTSPTNASILDAQGVGKITNDELQPPTPTLFISDVSIAEGNSGTSTATFTVTLSPASGNTVTVDFATANGTATLAGNDYQAASGMLTFNPGDTSKPINVTINGDTLVEPDENFFVNLTNATGLATIGDAQGQGTIQNDDTANLVISQVYPGGGLTGATFTNDFIELFNRGTTTVDFTVTPYSVQFLSTSSSTWAKTDVTSGTVAPGRYFLIRGANGTSCSGSPCGNALPTPDATGTLNMTSTIDGKVALVAGATLLTGNCPNDDGNPPFNPVSGTIADFVGYSGNASTPNHCYEGSGPASFTSGSNTTADFRKAGGCTDTNDNTADFLVSGPFPRNSSSPANNCAGGATPNLTINDVSVAEGNSGTTTATFTVSLSAPAQGTDVTFDIATADSTATIANNDYVAKSLTGQIIPAGQTTYTFSVTINGDTTVEPDETFSVNVSNVVGANITDGQGIGTIQNDDLPTLSIDDVSASEGDSGSKTFTFHVTLSAPAPAEVKFDIATADGTATVANNDYVARSITGQTIAAGSSSFNFDVTVNGDTNIEPDETFFVNVTNVSGATILDGQGQGTIQNDDSPVLSINSVSANEGNSGTTTFTFTVTSTLPAPAGGITFDIATADNTATSASGDYVARSLTGQTIPAGGTTYSFDVTVNGDTSPEPDETFFVNISNPSGGGATISGSGQGTGTIQNDDGALIVISQVYGGGGNGGAQFTNDFIEVFNRSATTVDLAGWSLQYASATGTTWQVTPLCASGPCLILPGHYFLVREGASGATNLPAPDATGTIAMTAGAGKVALVSNTTPLVGQCPAGLVDEVGYGSTANCFEGSGPTAAPGNTTAAFRKSGGCIDTNDNAADFVVSAPNPRNSASAANDCSTGFRPDISISDVTVTEGDSGTVNATFNVTLSAASTQTVTVAFATADGTATAGADYQTASGTVTFNPTETTKPIVITINSDLLDEANETFFVNLSNATNAAILDAQGQGTINDNDPTPSLSINDLPTIPEGDTGTSTATFTVTLSAISGQTVTVNYATADGTATTAGNDYVATNGTLTFAPGETTKPVPVTINGDTTFEPNETFFVNLTVPVNASISDSQGQGTITNDDVAPPSFDISINDVSVAEGNSGTKTVDFTVSLSNSSAQTVTVDYTTSSASPATATAGTDYVAAIGTVTFNPGEISKPITITINGDTRPEPDDTFFIDLTNATNASITDSRGVGTITNDDGALVVISQVYGGGGNSSATYNADFVELFNRSDAAVNITTWSVQYQSAATVGGASGTAWAVATLCPTGTCTIPANAYYLVRLTAPGATGAALPTPDSIPTTTINMAAGAGKVALVNSTTALVSPTGSGCPSSFTTVIDFVGYGSGAGICFEGSAAAPGPAANITSVLRKTSGCQDTNINSADFTATSTASARNSSSTNICP